jgi:hypothetical protein
MATDELDAYPEHLARRAAERDEPGPDAVRDPAAASRPASRAAAPKGYEFAIDWSDPWATGGHVPADADERPFVPKLRRVDRAVPTHPSNPGPLHFNGFGAWLPEEPS